MRSSLYLLTLLLPLIAHANQPIDIQAALGFEETFRIDRWTPLTVTLNNRGNDITGKLTIKVVNGDELQNTLYTTQYQRDLELPRDSRKRFRFTLFLENPAQPILIDITANNQIIAQQSIDLRTRFSNAQLILALSREANLDYLSDSSTDSIRVLYPHPELLPDHWQGYAGVAAMIIHGVSLEQLSNRQFKAIEKWLAKGGIIAIAANPEYALANTPRLAELIAIKPIGIAKISNNAKVKHSFSIPPLPKSFDSHHFAAIGDSSVLMSVSDFPLVVERGRGLGRVLYIAFDVARAPFVNWSGMRSLWHAVLRLPVKHAFYSKKKEKDQEKTNHITKLIKMVATGFPAHDVVLVFIALYLGILLTGYRLAAHYQTKAWLKSTVTWIAPIIFTCAAVLLFGPLLYPRGANAIVFTTIESIPDSKYAFLKLELGLYSTQQTAAPLRLSYRDATPVFLPISNKTSRFTRSIDTTRSDWLFHQGSSHYLQPNRSQPYTLHLLQGQDMIDFTASGSVTHNHNQLIVNLHMPAAHPLRYGWLLYQNKIYRLNISSAAASTTYHLSIDKDVLDLTKQDFVTDTAFDHNRQVLNEILSLRIRALQQIVVENKQAVVLSIASNALQLSDADDWQTTQLTLLSIQLPVIPDDA